jgi:hypothetical protein
MGTLFIVRLQDGICYALDMAEIAIILYYK